MCRLSKLFETVVGLGCACQHKAVILESRRGSRCADVAACVDQKFLAASRLDNWRLLLVFLRTDGVLNAALGRRSRV